MPPPPPGWAATAGDGQFTRHQPKLTSARSHMGGGSHDPSKSADPVLPRVPTGNPAEPAGSWCDTRASIPDSATGQSGPPPSASQPRSLPPNSTVSAVDSGHSHLPFAPLTPPPVGYSSPTWQSGGEQHAPGDLGWPWREPEQTCPTRELLTTSPLNSSPGPGHLSVGARKRSRPSPAPAAAQRPHGNSPGEGGSLMPRTRVAAAPLGGGGRLSLSCAGVCRSEVRCGFAHLVALPSGGWGGGQGPASMWLGDLSLHLPFGPPPGAGLQLVPSAWGQTRHPPRQVGLLRLALSSRGPGTCCACSPQTLHKTGYQ